MIDTKALKEEGRKAKALALMAKMRADANAVNLRPKRSPSSETPRAVASRARSKAWALANPERVKQLQQKARSKKKMESQSMIAEAIRQAEATRRNFEALCDQTD